MIFVDRIMKKYLFLSSIYHCHMPFPQHIVVDFADEDLHIIRLSFFFCFSLSSSPAPPLPLLQFDLFKPLNYLSMEPLETSVCRLVVPFCACLPRPLAPGRIASAGGGACGERRRRAGGRAGRGRRAEGRQDGASEGEGVRPRPAEGGGLAGAIGTIHPPERRARTHPENSSIDSIFGNQLNYL